MSPLTASSSLSSLRPRYWEPALPVVGLLVVFVLARYMAWGARRDIFATIRFEFLLGGALAGLCLLIVARRPPHLGMARGMILAILALFLTMVAAIPFAAAPELARDMFVDHVLKSALLTFYLAVLVTSPRLLLVFVATFLLAIAYVCQESVRGLISGGLIWWNQGIMRLHGAVPIYAHPNSLGAVALDPLPFAIFLWPVVRSWGWRAALLVISALSLVCVVYSGSRAAYVALLSLLLWWWWRSRHKGRWALLALLVAPIFLASLPEEYTGRFASIWGQEAAGQSKSARLQLLEDAWIVFLQNPLGVGLASFEVVREREFGRFQDTHNLYLQLGTHLGVQGVLAFAWVIWALARAYRRVTRDLQAQSARLRQELAGRQAGPELRRAARLHWRDLERVGAICEAAKAFLFIHLVLGFFGHDLYFIYWWFSAGLAISMLNITARMRDQTARLLLAQGQAAGSQAPIVQPAPGIAGGVRPLGLPGS